MPLQKVPETFRRALSDQNRSNWSIDTTFWMELPSPLLPNFFKYALAGVTYFPHCNLFLQRRNVASLSLKYSDELHATSSVLYSQNPPCCVHYVESTSFPMYFFSNKGVSPKQLLTFILHNSFSKYLYWVAFGLLLMEFSEKNPKKNNLVPSINNCFIIFISYQT